MRYSFDLSAQDQFMKLLIMRHGDALPAVTTDFARPLSPRGETQAFDAAKRLDEMGLLPELLLVSPLLRAQETSQQVQRLFSRLIPETLDILSPEQSPVEVFDVISEKAADVIMLVSHQPLVSRLVELLTAEQVFLDTANIACVDMSPMEGGINIERKGELLWVI